MANQKVFFVVDKANNHTGTVVVEISEKAGFVTLWGVRPDGTLVDPPGKMLVLADSIGRQLDNLLRVAGVTDPAEQDRLIAEAAEWVTEQTGGYTRDIQLTAGNETVHVITYDDAQVISIPLYVDEDGAPQVSVPNVRKPKNASFETSAEAGNTRRVIVSRSGGLAHLLKLSVATTSEQPA